VSLLLAIGALLKRIPWQLYVAIAIVSAFGLLLIDRNHWKAADARDHATAVNYRRQLDAETEKNKAAEKQAAQISMQLRDRTNEENRRIAGDADTLRLRGPGKAVCPALPSSPGGHQQAAPSSDAPVAQLPNTRGAELIALPFDDTIGFGKSYDELLNENKAWRDWHDQVLKVWPKTTEAPAH
jgi:hypothetical protein